MAAEKSWRQLVEEADPDRNERIESYVFGGGRVKLYEGVNPYGEYAGVKDPLTFTDDKLSFGDNEDFLTFGD